MYGFLTKLLLSGKLKFELGEIKFARENVTIISMDTMKDITDDALKEGKKGILRIYMYGWHEGFNFTKDYMKDLKLKKFEETYKLIMDVAEMIGYGDYKTLDFEQKKFSKFKNIGNPFAKLYHPSKDVVCHFVRGMNAGGGTALHEVLMNGIELECTAQNGNHCLFMNVSNKILREDPNFSKIVKKQLDLEKLKSRQIEIIKKYGDDPKKYLKYPK
ncbi:MAG: 4-vinyl reductase [archaeon]|nr:MAG: 4-vinyl reductase [archaeon]